MKDHKKVHHTDCITKQLQKSSIEADKLKTHNEKEVVETAAE